MRLLLFFRRKAYKLLVLEPIPSEENELAEECLRLQQEVRELTARAKKAEAETSKDNP